MDGFGLFTHQYATLTSDSQHPRDLFDIKLLYANEGLTDKLFQVFWVYVASSARPMHKLLAPQAPMCELLFEQEFVGMTTEPVEFNELAGVRTKLDADIKTRLTGDVAQYLLGLHDANPDFEALGFPQAAALPAVRWKVKNLARLKQDDSTKHSDQRMRLTALLH